MERQTKIAPVDSPFVIEEQGTRYGIFPLREDNPRRLAEYQRLRGTVFVERLGWKIPVDSEGKEVDRYDNLEANKFVRSHGVYGIHHHREYLLGGVRILTLRDWSDSMVENEFHANGMIPRHALQRLRSQYRCTDILELTRLCVHHIPIPPFRQIVARDLIYAAVYALAQATGRKHALVLVDSLCFQVVRRSHFIFREIHTHRLDHRRGYALVVIDLWDTIRAIEAQGDRARVERMLSLCA